MRLAVFDLDNTLLAGDSDYLWGRFQVEQGVVDADTYERENQRFYREYQAGTLDIHEYAAFALQSLVAQDFAHMQALRSRFVSECIAPIVATGTPALLERHRAQGDTLIITTATNRFVTEPIAALLGIDHLLATDPEIVDGRYTGRIAGIPNFQAGKVVRLRQWIESRSEACEHMSCYSDSHNDIPLLEMAQAAVAVDPDAVLQATAARRGWSIISLRGNAAVGH
ncbi:HAD family hydrolase [Sinimarinibacterium sp. CAU 1509]|uniref:histidinol-phosphatase n=1 Tax=Sinimarinibacterium sp. CAU 1509 TaxID=2562283 RepID=UPI0010AD221D|nr:HAD family hydrolase [Sinimarinibacterium sp. CAU 1509]TJY64852.1 HAD family hydrolase [Sinimarinibacterium sp. CAU 1509]